MRILHRTADVANGANTLLATGLSRNLAGWFADRFNHNSNVYDRAIDAVYNRTHVGGASFHHILDGNHSLWGAFRAAHDALPHDSFWDEFKGAAEHLARDTCSVAGINPFFSLSPGTFRGLADTLGVSRSWLGDMLTFNMPELIGAGLGVLPLALGWNRLGTERFAEMTATTALASVVSANPLLLAVSVTAAVRTAALWKREDTVPALRGLARGALTTGTAVMVSSALGFSPWLGAAVGIGAALGARHYFNRFAGTSEGAGQLVDRHKGG
ncbi:MAG: hypothetical protein AB1758_08090 [Candidatus Eremiobacterota bacterium]